MQRKGEDVEKRQDQIKIGAILSYVSIALNIIVGLLYTPWMREQIGSSNYGLYTLANSLITLFLVDFGLSAATARYLSKYRAEGEEEKANRFLGAIYKLYLIIDAVIFIILLVVFFFLENIYEGLTPAELQKFKVVYAIAAISSVCNFPFVTLNGVLTAYEQFVPLKTADLIYRVLIVGLTVAALLLGYGLYAVVTVNAVSGLLITAFKFIMIQKKTPSRADFSGADKGLYKEIFSFSLWATLASLAQRLIFNVTPSILGIVSNTAAIDVFGIIMTMEGYVYLITGAINGMFMPKISQLYAEGREQELDGLLRGVGKFQFAMNSLIVGGFFVVGEEFMRLWMGVDATAYYGILLVIIPGLFYNSLQIANTTLTVIKRVDLQAYVNLGMGVINVILSFILSKAFGVLGACVSIFIAYALRVIALNIVYGKVLPVHIGGFIRDCYLRMSLPLLIMVGAGIGLNYLLPYGGWMWLIIKAAIVVVVYFVFLLLVGLTKEDKKGIFGALKNKLFPKKQTDKENTEN